MLEIIKKRNIFLAISGAAIIASAAALSLWGLKFGIDFTDGSLLEVRYEGARPEISAIEASLSDLDLGGLLVQPIDDQGLVLRFQNTEEGKHQEVLGRLRSAVAKDVQAPVGIELEGATGTDVTVGISTPDESLVAELRYDSVGPSVGAELKRRAVGATFWVIVMMVAYIAWAFRHVSKPVASWKYGVAAVIALFHDVFITTGIFAFLGHFFGTEINTPFVAAILTVLGYSVNDTIVVFDRLRENLPKSQLNFEDTVNASINQTIIRSVNTSLTVMLSLVALLIFGGDTLKDFVLALIMGIFFGTYSSIFIASPVLVIWNKAGRK